MTSRLLIASLALSTALSTLAAQEDYDKELEKDSQDHMREELGVNEITTPSIQQVLKDLESFQPPPAAVLEGMNRDGTFENRLQTALHFGALVADGFVLTLAQRQADVEDIGRALIRQSRALGVGDRLTKRSKVLLELNSKGDWVGMREELVKTQTDVEQSMMDLHDEEMAHMISLGGWLRGFQLAANNCAEKFTPAKAAVLANPDIIDYYLDRLDTLHPRLKKTELVTTMIARMKELRTLATPASGQTLTIDDVKKMQELSNQLMAIALGPVDSEGNILKKTAL
jgi:hypothetical protein